MPTKGQTDTGTCMPLDLETKGTFATSLSIGPIQPDEVIRS